MKVGLLFFSCLSTTAMIALTEALFKISLGIGVYVPICFFSVICIISGVYDITDVLSKSSKQQRAIDEEVNQLRAMGRES